MEAKILLMQSDSIQRSAATDFKKTGKVISLYHRKFG